MKITRRMLVRSAKWGTSVLAVVLVAAFLFSLWRVTFVMSQFGDSLALRRGDLCMLWVDDHLRRQLASEWGEPRERAWMWVCKAYPPDADLGLTAWPGTSSSAGRWSGWIPLWIPITLCIGLSIVLWIIDQRHLPGDCVCGYSLAGLTPEAPCPECGRTQKAAIKPPTAVDQSTGASPAR